MHFNNFYNFFHNLLDTPLKFGFISEILLDSKSQSIIVRVDVLFQASVKIFVSSFTLTVSIPLHGLSSLCYCFFLLINNQHLTYICFALDISSLNHVSEQIITAQRNFSYTMTMSRNGSKIMSGKDKLQR